MINVALICEYVGNLGLDALTTMTDVTFARTLQVIHGLLQYILVAIDFCLTNVVSYDSKADICCGLQKRVNQTWVVSAMKTWSESDCVFAPFNVIPYHLFIG